MRKRTLEMELSRLDDMIAPVPELEQYRTPSEAVSDILFLALSLGDIEGRSIAELGCGGAPFLIGGVLLGAATAYGCDIDQRAVDLALSNVARASSEHQGLQGWVDLRIEKADVSDPDFRPPRVHTVLMNPPFGAQRKGADRPFIEKAMGMASVIHTVLNATSSGYMERTIERNGWRVTHKAEAAMEIGWRFHFHRKERSSVPTVRIRAVKEGQSLS